MIVGYVLLGMFSGLGIALVAAEALSLGLAGAVAVFLLAGNSAIIVVALLGWAIARVQAAPEERPAAGPDRAEHRGPDRAS